MVEKSKFKYILKVAIFVVFSLLKQLNAAESDASWTNVRPSEWNDRFPACAGQTQSPINVITSKTVYNKTLEPFAYKSYKRPIAWNTNFDGYSANFVPVYSRDTPDYEKAHVTGSNFKEPYYLANFHFHWGQKNDGSEHLIDGRNSTLEVHLVHANKAKTSYTVLGFMFEIKRYNVAFSRITRTLKRIKDSQEFVVEKPIRTQPFSLENLIPNLKEMNDAGYYRYLGSLTVPPCTEGIIWNLFRRKIPLSKNQAEIFDSYDTNENLSHRPVQPLNGRIVYVSRP